jgi:hypothetical protein
MGISNRVGKEDGILPDLDSRREDGSRVPIICCMQDNISLAMSDIIDQGIRQEPCDVASSLRMVFGTEAPMYCR